MEMMARRNRSRGEEADLERIQKAMLDLPRPIEEPAAVEAKARGLQEAMAIKNQPRQVAAMRVDGKALRLQEADLEAAAQEDPLAVERAQVLELPRPTINRRPSHPLAVRGIQDLLLQRAQGEHLQQSGQLGRVAEREVGQNSNELNRIELAVVEAIVKVAVLQVLLLALITARSSGEGRSSDRNEMCSNLCFCN